MKPRQPTRPPLSLIDRLPGWEVDLFVGDSRALGAPSLLARHGVTTVVNCAVNLDVDLVTRPAPEAEPGAEFAIGQGGFRYYKFGLVDGPGNSPDQMLGAYFILRGALDQRLPNRPSYLNRERGNLLVNCRGGRSRSVALAALFLHVEAPDRYPTLDAAIALIRERRRLLPEEWREAPKPEMREAAARAAARLALLRGEAAASGLAPQGALGAPDRRL